MAWYYQTSPHDTHDWDATEVAILVDGTIDGQPRKLLAQANRNGYFFLLDRTNGKSHRRQAVRAVEFVSRRRQRRRSCRIRRRKASPGGTLVFPTSDGAVNFPAQSFSPDTGLFYTNATDAGSIFYLSPDPDRSDRPRPRPGMARRHVRVAPDGDRLPHRRREVAAQVPAERLGIEPAARRARRPAAAWCSAAIRPAICVAFDAATGKILWHAQLGSQLTNSPQTYMLDGRQYVTVAAGDTLFAFYLQ